MTPEEKADLLHDCDLLAPAGDATTTRLNGVPILRVVKAARAYAEAQTNPPTPDEIKSARLQAYQNGWNDGYAEGRGKALVEAANIAEAYHKGRDTLHSRFTCQRIAAAIRARSET